MRLLSISVIAVMFMLVFATRAAHADWDSKGWTKLGERYVSGKVDRDSISVGAYKGKFTKLTLVVEKNDIELLEFQIVFANGERFDPALRHYFREGSRTRVIDLPGDERVIRTINMKYKNVLSGRDAKVEVWAWRSDGGPSSGGGGTSGGGAAWDSSGWKMLGERFVSGKVDRDRITVGSYKGKFEKLTMVVLDSDLELLDFEITFERGAPFRPALRHYFTEGQRTRLIDLPGDERVIRYIDMKYKNLPGGGSAKVQVWAR
jgi:hypothetical protein